MDSGGRTPKIGSLGDAWSGWLPSIWTLPEDDSEYSTRWNMLKDRFSREIDSVERISKNRQNRPERGIWQRRFWALLIEDQEDYNRHVGYIHWYPLKHGKIKEWWTGRI